MPTTETNASATKSALGLALTSTSDLKTFSAAPTHMVNICAKSH